MAVRTNDTAIFDNRPDFDDGTFGIDWGPLIGVGASYGLQFLPQPGGQQSGQCRAPAGCFQCRMTGQGDIAGCLDEIFVGQNGIYRLLVNGQIPNRDVLAIYQQVLAAVSSDQLFAQSDAYVQQAKQALQGHIARFQAANPNAAPSGGTTTQTVLGPNGQPIVIQVPAGNSTGLDTTTILLVGGALALILLLRN